MGAGPSCIAFVQQRPKAAPGGRIVQDRRMPAPDLPPAPRRRTRVLMAVHSAERGGAQLVALGQARALRRDYDLVIAVGSGPAACGFRRGRYRHRPRSDLPADLGRVARPVGAPDRPCHPGRGTVRRARPAASDRCGRRQQHGAGGARHRRPTGEGPGHRARAGGAEVRGRQATVPRARRAGAHGRRDLAMDRTGLRRCTRQRLARIPSASPFRAIRGRGSCAPPIRSGS